MRPFILKPVAVATVAVSAALVAFEGAPRHRPRAEPIELVGLTTQRVEPVTFEPGFGVWSHGDQIVAVAVQSGSLTVYGPEGERQVYGAGHGFAAGWTAFRTVNETDEVVEALLTIHGPA